MARLPRLFRTCWLVGGFGFNGPFRQYFSLYRAVSKKRGRKRKERIDKSTYVQTSPTRTNCKCNRPLPYCNQDCRTPRHWRFTQHHRTTRPPSNSSLSPEENIQWLQIWDNLVWFFYILKTVYCVNSLESPQWGDCVNSLESPQWGDFNEYTQLTFMLKKLKRYPYYASWPGAIINPHWLELPLSRTNFHGPKGVESLKFYCLYILPHTCLHKISQYL